MSERFMVVEKKPEPQAEKPTRVAEQAYLHTSQAGAMVPLLQSLITGVLIGLGVFVVGMKLRWVDAWFWGLLTWIIVQTVTWVLLQTHWWGLTALEKLTGVDFNRDGTLGEPVESRHTVRIEMNEVSPDGHLRVRTARFQMSDMDMEKLATGLVSGVPFAEDYWAGAGKLFSINKFREIRTEMYQRGMIEKVDARYPKQGYKLTRLGLKTMRELSHSPAPPAEVA